MSSIFISYSRKDKPVAERICAALAERSRDVWIDWEDIPPTAQWWREISQAIENADAFLFLISPNSVTSRVCKEEIAHAVALRKRLLPLVIRDTPAEKVAPSLSELNWLFFRRNDDFEQSMSQLLEALNTDLEWVRGHSRLLARAAEWERHNGDESYLLRGADLSEAETWLAGTADGKQPEPAPLHYEYLRACREAQAREVERLKVLYQNALSRQLAAQCTLLQRETDALLDRSILLAVESMRRVPNAEADRCLREGLRLRAEELARWKHEGRARLMAVSDEGDFFACCGAAANEATVFGAADFEERATTECPEDIAALAFIPGGELLGIADAGGALFCFDIKRKTSVAIGRHPGRIAALAALSDGTALVSAGEGGAICYEITSGAERWRLALDGAASVAASNKDATLVAVGAEDCIVRIVDARDGRLLHELEHDRERPLNILERGASDDGIVAVGFADGGARLCSAGLDGTVRVWDVASGSLLHSCVHARDLLCMAAHEGRGLVAGGGLDRRLRLWDIESGRETANLAHQGAVTAVAWSSDGKWLASACGDGTARLLAVSDTGTLTEISRCVHDDWVDNVVLPAGGIPLSVDCNGEVIAWAPGKPDWSGRDHDYSIKDAVCSDEGRYVLAFIDAENQILYDTHDDFSWRILDHPNFVDRAWITRDGAVITTCWDGMVREYDLATLSVRCVQAHAGRVWAASLSPDQNAIATAVQDFPYAYLWKRGETAPELELPHSSHVRSLAFAPDGRLIATASDDGSVRVWDLAGSLLWSSAHEGTAWWVGFDPSGKTLASAGEDGCVVLRDARSGAVRQTLVHETSVQQFAFSPDGNRLAVRHSFDVSQVPVWNLAKNEIIARLGHEKHIHRMDWSADSTLLATASQDHRVRVFDIGARSERIRLQYNDICVTARFVPDTQQLLNTSYDGSLRLSVVAPGELIESALKRVPRRLSSAEWQQYLPDERQDDV